MKIFVTGATGFVGAHFARLAHARGHQVIAMRRDASSVPVVAVPTETEWLTKPLEELCVEDFESCQALVHFAATGVSPKPAAWNECFRFNTQVTLALAQMAHDAGVERIVAAGTFAEYGRAGLRFDPIPADAPLEPTDPYAASKAASCIALAAFARFSKLKLFYGRIFSAFGEGQADVNFWPQLRKAALAGEDFPMTAGEQTRDFLPVELVAETFLKACTREDLLPGDPMIRNVASGEPVSLRDFAENWWSKWKATGKLKCGEIAYRPHEVMRYVPEVIND